MLLDACRSMIYTTASGVDAQANPNLIRRLVSETKKFVTESCQKAARLSMQVMGGIGYTNVYPVERIVRDLGLASIWTGTNEIMSMITSTEWYKESNLEGENRRPSELDAECAEHIEEKIF